MASQPAHIKVRNRLVHSDSVVGATVAVIGSGPAAASVSGTTNAHGVASLTLTGLAAGLYTLRVTPAATTGDPVGPDIASTVPVPARIFRPLDATVNVQLGKIKTASAAAALSNNGAVTVGNDPNATVDLQPVWMASPNHHGRGNKAIDLIVVHHTGGAAIGGALSTFLSPGGGKVSAHYVINTDGQIVKMVQDTEAAHHAGVSFWGGVNGVNDNSLGIEIVNATGPYPVAQYTALLDLLNRLLGAFTTVDRTRIVGHSDIAHNGHFVLGRKSGDPGVEFEWTRLEGAGLGMIPRAGPMPATIYGGFFALAPKGTLHKGDNDNHHKYGGKVLTGVTGTPIQELQEDLQAIGYSVGTPDGDFGQKTHAAVQMFQEHFFSGPRKGGGHDGKVDMATATMIKQVRP